MTPFSTITIDYSFDIEDLTTADPKIYIVNKAQMARFFKPNGKYTAVYQAAKKQSSSITFTYTPQLPSDFDINNPNTYPENAYQGETLYVVVYFSFISRTAIFEDSKINFIKFEKSGIFPVEPVKVYEFDLLSQSYESKHVDTHDGVGMLFTSRPPHQGLIEAPEFIIHAENTLHLTETIICALILITILGICAAFTILLVSFSAFSILMAIQNKKRKTTSEIYIEIKEQAKERIDAKPLMQTSGVTPGSPSADYGAGLLSSNKTTYTSVDSNPSAKTFAQQAAGYQSAYGK